jgi:hypothetical protein
MELKCGGYWEQHGEYENIGQSIKELMGGVTTYNMGNVRTTQATCGGSSNRWGGKNEGTHAQQHIESVKEQNLRSQ